MSLEHVSDEDLLTLEKLYRNKKVPANTSRLQGLLMTGGEMDLKFAYHLVRLMLEAEQIAQEHTLDIERNSNVLKSIRRGEWSIEQLENWFETKNNALETVYANSSLRNKPDENEIKKVLIECLEMHFGNLSNLKAAKSVDNSTILADLKSLIKKYE